MNEVVAPDMLAERTRELAARLASGPTVAYGEVKRLLRRAAQASLGEQLDAELAAFCRCAETSDFAEGMSAFFSKRKPVYLGK